MDPSLIQSNPSAEDEQEDEWDTDGFVIPSFSVDSDLSKQAVPGLTDDKPHPKVVKEEEKIYLGPHGAPLSQSKQQQQVIGGRKQRFKQKLKEADHKYSGAIGRENKVENIRELLGSKLSGNTTTTTAMMSKSSPRDWLDPHSHESQFERYSR